MVYLLLIFLAPVAACLWSIFGKKKAGITSLSGAVVSLAASVILLLKTKNGYTGSWTIAGLPNMPFRLEVTFFTASLSVVVATVSALIFLYAVGYMAEEKGKIRFWSGISLFLASMQVLLFAGDWILFVMAWELMGYASYHLISTKYWQQETGIAANKAFALNRFTDLGLYIGVFVIILTSGSSKIASEPLAPISQAGGFALLLAVMGKSAQVPFQSWLSAAMKGPTPVSALLHSATMVAAGVVLLLKAYPLFSPDILFWIGTVGGVTILLTGLTAIFSNDIKRMLAASSSSQLGFMVLAVGAGFPGAALGHLVAHAFMKSSLFLGAGTYQHATGSTKFEQIAGAGKKMKATFIGFAVAAVALAGIPPFIGYWSKDGILSAGAESSLVGWYFLAALAGALLTAFYMSRAMGILWKGDTKELEIPAGIKWMQTGLFAMVLFVAGGGLFLHKMVEMAHYTIPKDEIAKIGGLLVAIVGIISGWMATYKKIDRPLISFISNNYPIGGGYRTLVAQPVLKLAVYCSRADQYLHAAIVKIGSGALKLAALMRTSAQTIHKGVLGVGKFGLSLADWSYQSDQKGINELIAGLTGRIKALGQYGRQIQSGLVHKELMWSVWGMVAFLIVMMLTLI